MWSRRPWKPGDALGVAAEPAAQEALADAARRGRCARPSARTGRRARVVEEVREVREEVEAVVDRVGLHDGEARRACCAATRPASVKRCVSPAVGGVDEPEAVERARSSTARCGIWSVEFQRPRVAHRGQAEAVLLVALAEAQDAVQLAEVVAGAPRGRRCGTPRPRRAGGRARRRRGRREQRAAEPVLAALDLRRSAGRARSGS